MSLQSGSSKETISANIAELVKAGHPQNQAAAIAYKEAGKGANDEEKGNLLWEYFSTKAFWDHGAAPAADMAPELWTGLVKGLLAFFTEPVHQQPPPDVKAIASGIVYVQGETWEMPHVLLLKRSLDEEHYAGYWSIPGGKIDEDETPQDAAIRESSEEIGVTPDDELNMEVLKITKLPLGDEHVTFLAKSHDQFVPKLNSEHIEYMWAPLDMLPKPIHPGVKTALGDLAARQKEVIAKDGSWFAMAADRAVGPYDKPELAQLAFDRATWRTQYGVAFDRATVRSIDANGFLHIDISHISKATVNPYKGSEIPDWQSLGLEPDRIYQLLRDPEELEKAASSFNNLPLLNDHVPVTTTEFPANMIVGSTGTDAVFRNGYLDNSLVVYRQDAIDAIDDEEQKELSSAYRYVPDMTPGTRDGMKYDGVMRAIAGNHVALVKKGRAGPDVVVGDSALKPKETEMSKKTPVVLSRTALYLQCALQGYALPKIAQDKKLDLMPIFAKVNRKTLFAKDGKIKTDALASIIKLARDAADPMLTPEAKANGGLGPDDIIMHLLTEGAAAAQAEAPAVVDEPAGVVDPSAPDPAAAAADPAAKIIAVLKAAGVGDDVIAQVQAMMKPDSTAPAKEPGEDEDEIDPATGKPKVKPATDDGGDMPKNAITEAAMDAAIKKATTKTAADVTAAVTARLRGVHEARQFVLPFVGDLPGAYDSAEEVHRAALKVLGVNHEGKHPDALTSIIEAQAKPDAGTGRTSKIEKAMASDKALGDDFFKQFPGTANIHVMA